MRRAVSALTGAALIGAVSGLRSQWGTAAVSWTTRTTGAPSAAQALLAGPWVRGATLAAAAGEFVADKSPRIPSRLSPAGLGPRLVMGALAAAALSQRRRGAVPPAAAAAAGASAALASAYAGARWRRAAGSRAGTDAVAAAVEDVLAAALAWAACGSRTSQVVAGPPGTGDGDSREDATGDAEEGPHTRAAGT